MARTGRPPKPREQRRHEGTTRASDPAPLILGGRSVPEPPAYLTDDQRECFAEIVETLREGNILDAADAGMVELAAIEEANVRACNAYVAKHGVVITGAMGGPVVNPASTSRAKSLNHLRQLYAELGIGPASRARLQNLGVRSGREPKKGVPGLAEFELKAVPGGKTRTG